MVVSLIDRDGVSKTHQLHEFEISEIAELGCHEMLD